MSCTKLRLPYTVKGDPASFGSHNSKRSTHEGEKGGK